MMWDAAFVEAHQIHHGQVQIPARLVHMIALLRRWAWKSYSKLD